MSDAYDLAGARKAGISDEDSLNHLASVNGYDLAGARAAGISDTDSLNHLMTVNAAPEPVVEKESPEALGGIGATIGAVGAAGDVIYSKGRPLFRMAEKAMGMDSGAPTVKPRTFLDPATVAEQAIARRTATAPDVTGSPSAVKNWAGTQHEGDFLGGAEYKDADRIKKEALAFEKQNPTQKVLPGSLLAVPEEEAKRLAQQRAELAAQQDIAKQAEVQKVAQTRAERLGERAELKGKSNQFGAAKGAGNIAVKVGAPVLGGYEAGSQGAQAYNRLTRPDLTASDVAAGATNIVGSGAGALSMVPSKYRIPAAVIAQGAGAIANFLDKRNPRKEEVEIEQKAAGGLAGYAEGGGPKLPGKFAKVQKAANVASGFLKTKPSAPDPLVGTRYKTTDMNRLLPQTPFDPEQYIGAKILHRPYDLSSRGQRVEEISGHKLTNPFETEGGQQFGRDKLLQATGQGGASNKEINDRILKRVDAAAREGNGQVLNIPSTMGYGSEDFSTMPVTALLDLLRQREFNPTTLEMLSNQVRAFDPKKFSKFVGFGKDKEELLMKQIMEGGYELNTTPGQLRKIISDRLRLKGPKANNQQLLDYNSEDLYNAIRDPNLRDVPPGFMGHTVMEAQPGHPGFNIGNHSAYNAGDASKYIGQGINAPISVWMPDSYKQALAITRADPKTADWALGHQRAMARNVLGTQESGVAQTLTPQVADNLKKYQAAVDAGDLNAHDLDAVHKYLYGKKAGEFAAGGEVKHFEGGGKTGALLSLLKPAVNRIDMHFKDVIKRTPQITEAARLLKEGKLSREEFDRIVNQFKPVTPYNFVPQPATEAEAMDALGKKGIGKFKLALPEGHPVDLRLDIPAYKDKGVWVNSIHNAGQKNVIPDTSYSNVAAARDVGFEITPRNQERFLNYAADLEGQNKFTGARMQGLWTPMDDKDFIEKSQDALRSKDWTQIGMDPERHGYFYDRTSMEPIAKADEVLQVGPLVLGKNPKYGKKKDSLYAQGGLVDNYAPGGRIVKGALDALNKASEGKLGQVANKDLTTLQDYHTSLGDRVAAGAKEMQDKIAAAQFKYKKGDRVFTDWTAKNNYPPYEILGTRILGGKFGTILRDPATGKALRDENGKALREAEHVGYQVRHDFTPHGETEPSWRIHTMPETSFKGLIEPEEPYKKGGKVKKK